MNQRLGGQLDPLLDPTGTVFALHAPGEPLVSQYSQAAIPVLPVSKLSPEVSLAVVLGCAKKFRGRSSASNWKRGDQVIAGIRGRTKADRIVLSYWYRVDSEDWKHVEYVVSLPRCTMDSDNKSGGSGRLGDSFPPRQKGMHDTTYFYLRVRAVISLQEAIDLLIRADAAMGWQATNSELKHAA